jgi:hypothetical protein
MGYLELFSYHFLARAHSLSAYVPICQGCGLVLCELNLPQFSCPHCDSQILTPLFRAYLLPRLKEQISVRIGKEEQDRERELEDARRAAGAFPALIATDSSAPVAKSAPPNQTHKVLSLNHRSKKVTVSYTVSPTPSRPLSRAENIEEQPVRIPKPSDAVLGAKLDYTRPWADLRSGDRIKYIPRPARPIQGGSDQGGSLQWKKTRRNKGQKKVVESELPKARIDVEDLQNS